MAESEFKPAKRKLSEFFVVFGVPVSTPMLTYAHATWR